MDNSRPMSRAGRRRPAHRRAAAGTAGRGDNERIDLLGSTASRHPIDVARQVWALWIDPAELVVIRPGPEVMKEFLEAPPPPADAIAAALEQPGPCAILGGLTFASVPVRERLRPAAPAAQTVLGHQTPAAPLLPGDQLVSPRQGSVAAGADARPKRIPVERADAPDDRQPAEHHASHLDAPCYRRHLSGNCAAGASQRFRPRPGAFPTRAAKRTHVSDLK